MHPVVHHAKYFLLPLHSADENTHPHSLLHSRWECFPLTCYPEKLYCLLDPAEYLEFTHDFVSNGVLCFSKLIFFFNPCIDPIWMVQLWAKSFPQDNQAIFQVERPRGRLQWSPSAKSCLDFRTFILDSGTGLALWCHLTSNLEGFWHIVKGSN